jgi:hypothetical protein
MYPWPIGDFDCKMDEALDIALNYLECTGQGLLRRYGARSVLLDRFRAGKDPVDDLLGGVAGFPCRI